MYAFPLLWLVVLLFSKLLDLNNKKPADIVTIFLGTNDAKAFNWNTMQQDFGELGNKMDSSF